MERHSEVDLHIGRMIQAVAKQKRLSTYEIQDALGTGERSVSYVFNRPDISVKKLWRISDRMNYNFFADLHPIISEPDPVLSWEKIAQLYKTEQVKRVSIEIQFPVSLAKDLGSFIMQANALGLKTGFKVG